MGSRKIMAIQFTEKQTRVLEARDHNILVSAAAGSGKTAVLVERIVRMISEGERPLDIDRLLVVTFTRAAAAQMRERIARAVSDRLREDPSNAHLRRQETLIHNAQITTIDSFCSYLLRNNFSEIDLDRISGSWTRQRASSCPRMSWTAFWRNAISRRIRPFWNAPPISVRAVTTGACRR
jgi:superfamily I DNA/RNA helicase